MKHTKEEIVNALKVIKEECADHVCPDCPFFAPKQSDTVSSCRIKNDAPQAWNITENKPETWRAFK